MLTTWYMHFVFILAKRGSLHSLSKFSNSYQIFNRENVTRADQDTKFGCE